MTIKKKPKEPALDRIIIALPSSNAQTKEFYAPLGEDDNDRMRVRVVVDKGNVCDLVVQYETMRENQWFPVVRYDIAHGYFHKDVYQGDKQVDKEKISIPDLNSALTYAKEDIKDNWLKYKRIFFRKPKRKGK